MHVDHAFYFLATVLVLWCVTLRLARTVIRRPASTGRVVVVTGVFAASAALLPFGQFSLWRWLYSAHANPSIPFVGILAIHLLSVATGRAWFERREWLTTWLMGALLGTWLYLPILGLAHYDVYAVHWEGRWIAAGATVIALALLATGNRAGLLLGAGLLGHLLGVLESGNLWDYLVDPFLWLLSLIGLVHAAVQRVRGRGGKPHPTPAPAARPLPLGSDLLEEGR